VAPNACGLSSSEGQNRQEVSQFGVLKPTGELASPVQGLLTWGATVGAAFASYVLIERPALPYKDRFGWVQKGATAKRPAQSPLPEAVELPAIPRAHA